MGLITARAKLTNADGKIYTMDSAALSVNKIDPTLDPAWGGSGYKDLTIEYQAGYNGRSCSFFITNETGEIARLSDIVVSDPDGAVVVSTGSSLELIVTSTGRNGLVAFKIAPKFNKFMIWDNTGLINGIGYPALKGFRSFGNTLTIIELGIIAYNFYVPIDLPTTLKVIKFCIYSSMVACTYFNDPNVINWDVSNLMPASFDEMFYNCNTFNQNLSGWCVSQRTTAPASFSIGSPLTDANKPVWGTCPADEPPGVVVISPTYSSGYYDAASGGSKVTASQSTATKYLRFKLDKISAGTVLTLRAGGHGTGANGSGYYTDFTVLQAGGAVDSSNGVRTRMYGDNVTAQDITLTFTQSVNTPIEFVIGVNMYNAIYSADKYSTNCTNYVYLNGTAIVAAYIALSWSQGY